MSCQLEPVVRWPKQAGETVRCEFRFDDCIEFTMDPAQDIASATVDSVPPGLTVSTAFEGSRVQVLVSGGEDGEVYGLTCTIDTSGGSVRICEGELVVYA